MHVFAIPDAVSAPADAAGLTFLGRIPLQEHMAARAMWAKAEAAGVLIHPFEDIRLTLAQVKTLASIAGESHANKNLSQILTAALARGMGVVSFCD